MHRSIIFLTVILGPTALADSRRDFSGFSAPGIEGAYCAAWSPLGVTTSGYNFSIGFYQKDGGESNPSAFWVAKKSQKILQLDNIAAENQMLADFSVETKGEVESLIRLACKSYKVPTSAYGSSALTLDMDMPRLVQLVDRLKSAGLESAACALLLDLGKKATHSVDAGAGRWEAMWYEVNKLGGIERLSVSGISKPFRVKRVVREEVYDAGTVQPGLLERAIFFDLGKA